VALAGRMRSKREMGKTIFADITDGSGDHAEGRIQLFVNPNYAPADVCTAFKHWDLGDIVGC